MRKSYFNSAFFAGNRERLRALFIGKAPIVITANGLLQRSGETNYPFKQDSNFWYLTGINAPDVILVLDKEKEYLILPDRLAWQDIADGKLNIAELAKTSGIKTIYDQKAGMNTLSPRIKKSKHLAALVPTDTLRKHYAMYPNPARANLIELALGINPDIKFLDLRPQFSKLRQIKQPAEIKVLQDAIDVTVRALNEIKKNISKFSSEVEIEALLTKHFRLAGGDGHAFQPIVAAGQNACTIHYMNNNSKINKNQLVLIDTGAEVENYSADISRTYAVTTPTKRQSVIIEAVNETQAYGITLVKPGVLLKNLETNVEHYMGEKLRELGLIKSIKSEEVRKYFPTRTSHFLGLDTHDAGDYDTPLEPGMVITVEPGIYISKEKIGVRTEDDILVTENGSLNLSRKARY